MNHFGKISQALEVRYRNPLQGLKRKSSEVEMSDLEESNREM